MARNTFYTSFFFLLQEPILLKPCALWKVQCILHFKQPLWQLDCVILTSTTMMPWKMSCHLLLRPELGSYWPWYLRVPMSGIQQLCGMPSTTICRKTSFMPNCLLQLLSTRLWETSKSISGDMVLLAPTSTYPCQRILTCRHTDWGSFVLSWPIMQTRKLHMHTECGNLWLLFLPKPRLMTILLLQSTVGSLPFFSLMVLVGRENPFYLMRFCIMFVELEASLWRVPGMVWLQLCCQEGERAMQDLDFRFHCQERTCPGASRRVVARASSLHAHVSWSGTKSGLPQQLQSIPQMRVCRTFVNPHCHSVGKSLCLVAICGKHCPWLSLLSAAILWQVLSSTATFGLAAWFKSWCCLSIFVLPQLVTSEPFCYEWGTDKKPKISNMAML